jgi:hypothetical protein
VTGLPTTSVSLGGLNMTKTELGVRKIFGLGRKTLLLIYHKNNNMSSWKNKKLYK